MEKSIAISLKNQVLVGLLGLVVSGCSDGDSSYAYSQRTQSLIEEAQNGSDNGPGVKQALDSRFGNPQQLKAWMKLPVQWGGSVASVDSIAATEQGTVIKFKTEEGVILPASAATVQFVTGERAGQTVALSNWDKEAGEGKLDGVTEEVAASGDLCVLDGGSTLKSGRMLYMRHCSHCHGTAGDGQGPTAQYMIPKPRDYRHGVFKFTSTNDQSKVSRNDLMRVLKYGIPGTYMPSFLLMKEEELQAIVEYVRFLSMRGEYERRLVNELASDYSKKAVSDRLGSESRPDIVKELESFLKDEFPSTAETLGDDLAEGWTAADTEEARIIPTVARVEDTEESRQRGRDLYLSKTLNCADCHGIDGAGNGPQTIAFEKNPVTNELYPEAGLHDVWDNLNQPRNLQRGIFRGGRRPIDLFCRIHAGIKGSRMPSFKNTPHEDIWHIVNYLLSLQFEAEPGAIAAAPVAASETGE
jgi:mono/diheme cytochrome c family protein